VISARGFAADPWVARSVRPSSENQRSDHSQRLPCCNGWRGSTGEILGLGEQPARRAGVSAALLDVQVAK